MGGYRYTDPDTSKRAYLELENSGELSKRRLEACSALAGAVEPLTAGEIAERLGDQNRNNVATRLSELEGMRVVEKVYERACRSRKSSKVCWTWQLTGRTPVKLKKRPSRRDAKLEAMKDEIKILRAENARLQSEVEMWKHKRRAVRTPMRASV